jgi:hypothetical protein
MQPAGWRLLSVFVAGFLLLPVSGQVQEEVSLAQQTQNPVADLIVAGT